MTLIVSIHRYLLKFGYCLIRLVMSVMSPKADGRCNDAESLPRLPEY